MYNNDAMIFDPIYIEKPWGGKKLTGKDGIGEAFLISDINGSETTFNGKTITSIIKDKETEYLGNNIVNKYGNKLPIYMKELDAVDNLSVQVHPDNTKAQQLENEKFGKSESWFILDAGEGGGIYLGFKNHVTKEILKQELENSGDISKLLNFIPVKPGDFYYIPAGLVHAIGKNVHLLEPQQNSNRTYRVWDWNRVDQNGNSRELHIDKSLDVLNFDTEFNEKYSQKITSKKSKLLSSDYFDVEVIDTESSLTLTKADSYRLLTLISGEISITIDGGQPTTLLPHKACFIPAYSSKIDIIGSSGTKMLIACPR